MSVRRASLIACLAAFLVAVSAASATSPAGFGNASCLRGEWRAGRAETARVVRSLVPVARMEVKSTLYIIFRDNAFQYGTTSMIITMDLGDATLTAKARFFTLAPYGVPRPGALRLSRGSSTIEYGDFSGTKNGRTYTVPGPAPRTTRVPAGTVPFQCRGATLRVKLPSISSLGWITLRRAS